MGKMLRHQNMTNIAKTDKEDPTDRNSTPWRRKPKQKHGNKTNVRKISSNKRFEITCWKSTV